MKVLHVYQLAPVENHGGIEAVIRELSRPSPLPLKVRSVGLQALHRVERFSKDGVRGYHIPLSGKARSMRFSWVLLRHFRRLSAWADILHFHYPWPFGDLLSFFVKKPYIVTYHSDIVKQRWLKKAYSPLERVFLKRAEKLVATSPSYAQLSSNLRLFKTKTNVIPIGIQTFQKPKPPCLQKMKQRVPYPFTLFVGALRYYKGLHILLQAAPLIRGKVVIAGVGPEEGALKNQARGLSNVFFFGRVSEEEKAALLSLATSFVFPSHLKSEAFGVALLEAAAAKLPLVSTEIGTGTSFINQDGETGYVVPPENPQALAEAVNVFFDNQDIRTKMGKAAQSRYQALFTDDKMRANYYDLYEQIFPHP